MNALASLIQTLIWPALILWLVHRFSGEIRKLAKDISDRIERGGEIVIGPLIIKEFRKELDTVQKAVSSMESQIAALFMATMSRPMYVNLKKIGSGNFGSYKMSQGLERELYHLRDIGYIAVPSIKAIPTEGADLSDFVKISSTGKQFIELREAAGIGGDR